MKCQEKSRLWTPLVPSLPVQVRREAASSAGPLNCTLSDGRTGPVEGEASRPQAETEGQAMARPEMSWRSLSRVQPPKEDDLKDRSIFIFSFVSHVLEFS